MSLYKSSRAKWKTVNFKNRNRFAIYGHNSYVKWDIYFFVAGKRKTQKKQLCLSCLTLDWVK